MLGARKTVGGEANNVTNSLPQEEIKEGRKDEGDMDVIEEASLLKEDEELLLKAAVFMQLLEAEREKNKELEGKVAEMEENEVTLRAFTKLCQKDVDIMEGRVERSERKEKELKAQVLELIRELGEARSKERVALKEKKKVSLVKKEMEKAALEEKKKESLANEAMRGVSLPPVDAFNFRSEHIREKERVVASSSGSSSS